MKGREALLIAIMVIGLLFVVLRIVTGIVGLAVGGVFKLVGCLFIVLAIGAALIAALPVAVISVVVIAVLASMFRR